MHLGVCNHESHMKPCTRNILCKLTPLFYRGEDGLLQGIPDIAIDSQELLKLHSFKPALEFLSAAMKSALVILLCCLVPLGILSYHMKL